MRPKPTYHESLLHWIWGNGQLAHASLTTTAGKDVHIFDAGKHNVTDGPDFIHARIAIGELSFHGDVEIHWSARDWFRHGHHIDTNYDRVVLHVIFDDNANPKAATRSDGSSIPTLCLKPFLDKPLLHFFKKYRKPSGLPCSNSISFISPEVFKHQIEKAHKEYFEHKVNDLLQFYDPALPLSKAWQNLLIIALFDGLGIAHNREPMQRVAVLLLNHFSTFSSKQALVSFALKEAGIAPAKQPTGYHWKRKGSRPANHPRHRIIQGCELLWAVKKRNFSTWLRTDIHSSFNECRQQIEAKPGLGNARADILFGTVWILSLIH